MKIIRAKTTQSFYHIAIGSLLLFGIACSPNATRSNKKMEIQVKKDTKKFCSCSKDLIEFTKNQKETQTKIANVLKKADEESEKIARALAEDEQAIVDSTAFKNAEKELQNLGIAVQKPIEEVIKIVKEMEKCIYSEKVKKRLDAMVPTEREKYENAMKKQVKKTCPDVAEELGF